MGQPPQVDVLVRFPELVPRHIVEVYDVTLEAHGDRRPMFYVGLNLLTPHSAMFDVGCLYSAVFPADRAVFPGADVVEVLE